jgi:2-keto-myo-inositol isomerase
MNLNALSRRQAISTSGFLLTAALAGPSASAVAGSASTTVPNAGHSSFRFCLNTATIRGQKLGIDRELKIASDAGYDAIEPWIESIDAYKSGGGNLSDLRKRASDLGVTIESAIGFPEWLVDDDARRAKGMERAKYEMDLLAQIGGKRLACPPSGITDLTGFDSAKATERYRALLEIGDGLGVLPQFELWGFSKSFHRLGDCVGVAMETGHPKACVLIDVFHLHKGGSDARGLRLLAGNTVQVLHMNDYPSDPPREKIDDSFRVYPGDGVAPIREILGILKGLGGPKVLSLELFSRKMWEQDPLTVAKAGLAKMKALV